MSSEIGHADITDRQLIQTGAPARKSLSREIGEAEVVHTLFGRARVRIIRKEDGFRHNLWWIVLAVMLTAVAVQIWLIAQHDDETVVEVVMPVMQDAASAPVATEAQARDPEPAARTPAARTAVVAPIVPPPAATPARPPQAPVASRPPPGPVPADVRAAMPAPAPAPARPAAQPQPRSAAPLAASAPVAATRSVTTTEAAPVATPVQPAEPQL